MTQPWYPFYWSDYSGKTMHLTMSQHGAYILFLLWIYTTGKPIPAKQSYSIARAMSEQERSDVDFVLSEFFTLVDGQWVNDRATAVIAEQEIKHQRRVNAGKMGGERKSSNAKAMPKQSSSNQNQNQNQIDNSNELSPPTPKPRAPKPHADFEAFYAIYPHKVGRDQAEKAYHRALKTKGVTHAILIDGAQRFAAAHAAAGTEKRYVAHPATWLNGGRWKDDLSAITARRNTLQPAANARGSQFRAVTSALSSLLQDDHAGNAGGGPELSQGYGLPSDQLQPADGCQPGRLPGSADRDDPAGGQTIDHDPLVPVDG